MLGETTSLYGITTLITTDLHLTPSSLTYSHNSRITKAQVQLFFHLILTASHNPAILEQTADLALSDSLKSGDHRLALLLAGIADIRDEQQHTSGILASGIKLLLICDFVHFDRLRRFGSLLRFLLLGLSMSLSIAIEVAFSFTLQTSGNKFLSSLE